MATWLLPGAPSQPSTIRASTECLFLTWRTRRVAVSKSKTMGQPHPGVPTGCRLYEPLDLGFGEVLPPCSSAFGRRRAQLQRAGNGIQADRGISAKCRVWRSRTRPSLLKVRNGCTNLTEEVEEIAPCVSCRSKSILPFQP